MTFIVLFCSSMVLSRRRGFTRLYYIRILYKMSNSTKDRRLCDAELNERAVIKSLGFEGTALRRFLDLGLIPGTRVTPLYRSLSRDPTAYLIRGAVVALRKNDCKEISIY